MRKLLLAVLLLVFCFWIARAEEYLGGRLIAVNKLEKDILYDRTQLSISGGVFQSVYKVFNTDKVLLYTVTVTHDQKKEVMFFGLKTVGGGVKGFTVRYNSDSCGLIFSDMGNLDTLFDSKLPYRYLVSFTDSSREYPVVHCVKTDDGGTLVLDPMSRIRLKLHKERLRSVGITPPLVKRDTVFQSKDVLSSDLYKARLELYKLSAAYTDIVTEIRISIQKEIKERFIDNKVFSDERRYAGDTRKGLPEGNGLLIERGNIFQGYFNEGMLNRGNAAIKTSVFEYVGQYSGTSYNGVGWLKYANGSYLLGAFSKAVLVSGLTLSKDAEGEIYYGSLKNNQRTGYGELKNSNGNFYFGEFVNGKLVRGFTKEVDQFGYAIYSKVENGNKTIADPQIAEQFFGAVLLLKN